MKENNTFEKSKTGYIYVNIYTLKLISKEEKLLNNIKDKTQNGGFSESNLCKLEKHEASHKYVTGYKKKTILTDATDYGYSAVFVSRGKSKN